MTQHRRVVRTPMEAITVGAGVVLLMAAGWSAAADDGIGRSVWNLTDARSPAGVHGAPVRVVPTGVAVEPERGSASAVEAPRTPLLVTVDGQAGPYADGLGTPPSPGPAGPAAPGAGTSVSTGAAPLSPGDGHPSAPGSTGPAPVVTSPSPGGPTPPSSPAGPTSPTTDQPTGEPGSPTSPTSPGGPTSPTTGTPTTGTPTTSPTTGTPTTEPPTTEPPTTDPPVTTDPPGTEPPSSGPGPSDPVGTAPPSTEDPRESVEPSEPSAGDTDGGVLAPSPTQDGAAGDGVVWGPATTPPTGTSAPLVPGTTGVGGSTGTSS